MNSNEMAGLTIAKRAAILEITAAACSDGPVKTFYAETARVLQGVAAQYNALYAAAVDTIQRSNHEDPAITVLIRALEEQGHKPMDTA